jgi:sulfonate transport system substrate-binding protein
VPLLVKHRADLEPVLAGIGAPPPAWRLFASGPPLLEALGTGALDFGHSGDLPTLFAQAAGGQFRYVAALPLSGRSGAILVPAASDARSAADLRGRRIGFTRGSSAQVFVERALADAGLALSDVRAVNLQPPDAAAAFASGALDAWTIWDPYFAAAEVEQGARVLVSGQGVLESAAFLLARPEMITERRPELDAILATMRATAAWAAANREAMADIFASETGLARAVQQRVAERQDLEVTPMTPAVIARHQAIADDLFARGEIPRAVDVASASWTGPAA